MRIVRNKTLFTNLAVITLLSLLVVIFYSNRVFQMGLNDGEDIVEQEIPHIFFYLPHFRHLVRNFSAGDFPLWNPHKVCGVPFFEASFMGPYYPFVLLYLFLPIMSAINAGFVVHILFSGIATYFLSRQLKFSSGISFFVAFSWMLSGVFQNFSESGWLTETIPLSYLPLLIFLFIKIVDSQSPRRIIFTLLAGLALGLVIFGGKPNYATLVQYCFLIFCIPSLKNISTLRNVVLLYIIGLTLSIVAWGPMLIQFMRYFPPQKLPMFGYTIGDLMNFFLPVDIRRGFAGRVVLILAFIGLLRGRAPFKANFLLLFFSSFIFMFGESKIGTIKIVDLFPFMNQLYYLWVWHAPFIFSLVLLSGMGLEEIRLRLANRRRSIFIVFIGLAIVLQLSDVYSFNRRFYPKDFKYRLEEYLPSAPFIEYLKKDPSCFRISNQLFVFPLFRINQGMMSGISCFETRLRGINVYKLTGLKYLTFHLTKAPSGRTLDVCNIKYIITLKDLPPEQFTRCMTVPFKSEKIFLYRNDRCFPRAVLIEGARSNDIRDVLLKDYHAPLLLLKIPDDAWEILSVYKEATMRWTPNTYTVTTESASDSFLFLSEMFEPGWRSTIDGVPAETLSPFNFFMGVFVPAGTHTVVFRFAPMYFYVFAGISAASWLVLIFIIVYLAVRLKRRPRETT